MKKMCTAAGITCEDIKGYGRGYSFGTGAAESVDQVNHAWSAVRIAGRWYLVDTTWDAGHVEEKAYRKQYRTTYLFMPPQDFIYTHLPGDSRWQLLRSPLTAAQFEQLPHLRGAFFDQGLFLATRLQRVTSVGKGVQFAVRYARPVELMADLHAESGKELSYRGLVQHEQDMCRIFVTFPSAGRHRLKLYCRPRGGTGSMKLVANLDFDAAEGTDRAFPKTFSAFQTARGYLFSPLYTPIARDRPVTFRVRLQGLYDPSLAIGDQPWLKLKRSPSQSDVYEITMSAPAKVRVRLNAKTAPQNKSYTTLIDFSPEIPKK
jgi:hypothetical protein